VTFTGRDIADYERSGWMTAWWRRAHRSSSSVASGLPVGAGGLRRGFGPVRVRATIGEHHLDDVHLPG